MKDIKEFENNIIQGDCLKVLKTLPDEFVDLIITSPPYYGLRKYGDYDQQIGLEKTFDEFLKKILEITAELKRVLKPSGQFWLNFGDAYNSHSIGKGNVGGIEGQHRERDKNYRNSLGMKMRIQSRQVSDKCLMMMPERIALKMIDDQGWILRNKVKWAKQVLLKKEGVTKGSVMPTSVKDRFNESGEELYFFVKNKKYYSDLGAVRLPPQSELNFERPRMGQGNQTIYEQKRAAGIIRQKYYPESKYNKFNYRVRDAKRKAGQPQFKASEEEIKSYKQNYIDDDKGARRTRTKIGLAEYNRKQKNSFPKHIERNAYLRIKSAPQPNEPNAFNEAGKNLPTVWLIGSEPHNFQKELQVDVDHFAIFPQALCEIPIKFGCPPGGLVLDPFSGSGTVALVARSLGRKYLGIELNKEYIKLTEKRLGQDILI